jgi:hypothetical protein
MRPQELSEGSLRRQTVDPHAGQARATTPTHDHTTTRTDGSSAARKALTLAHAPMRAAYFVHESAPINHSPALYLDRLPNLAQ